MEDFLKSLNPKTNEKHILIYGKEYKLWREGKYLDKAIWTKDENVGDSFQTKRFDEKIQRHISDVWIADAWELIINP